MVTRSTLILAALALPLTAGLASPQTPNHRHPAPVPALSLASVSSAGAQGNGWSGAPALTASGRFVAFGSFSDDLVPGDTNGTWDVFVRDRELGVTERVSLHTSGAQPNGMCSFPSISDDGRMVAFQSVATNLFPGDANAAWDVFVHDRASGETRLVSRSSAGEPGDGPSQSAVLSADGSFVAFQSHATNLAPDPNGAVRDVFVHDLRTGETELVSVSDLGLAGNMNSDLPSISADGSRISFHSNANNLVPGDTNGMPDVFVRDRLAGTTRRVSVATGGVQASVHSYNSSISADGRFVAFQTAASLVPADDDGGFLDVYVHDLATGETLGITPGDPAFAPDETITLPSISGDGLRVAFQAVVIPYPVFAASQIFVHDRATGATTRLSERFGVAGDDDSTLPVISGGGGVVAFESRATNLVRGDSNNAADVLVHAPGGE